MQKLRNRIIRIAFISSLVVFLTVSVMVNYAFYQFFTIRTDQIIELIAANGGTMPEGIDINQQPAHEENKLPIGFTEESYFRVRYFVVVLDDDNHPTEADIVHIASVSGEEALSLAKQAVTAHGKRGYINTYRYQERYDLHQIIFVDASDSMNNLELMILMMLFVSLLFTVLITIIFAIISGHVLRPFEENSKRQKQFITDASHELKTPLAIISANAEVLQYKNGKNEWTEAIVTQTKRMSKLINELLALSKMEEVDDNVPMERLEFGPIIRKTLETFDGVVEQKAITLDAEVGKDIFISGNREQLEQLVSILTENASKYVREEGMIGITLTRTGRYAIFRIFNTADVAKNFDTTRLFDRFYRSDSSRSSQTGGHGIGLSIAKKIVKQHRGSIQATPLTDGLEFVVQIPISKK